MTHDNLDLGALIGSRICHDLISPIGAIGNGLELLRMSLPPSPELALISDSIENASARVRFFRVAFGRASEGQPVPLGEIEGILRDLSHGGRIAMHWRGDTSPDRLGVRIAFLAVMCLETTLPFGGEIIIDFQNDKWTLSASGRRIHHDAGLWANLDPSLGPIEKLTPGHVQFALLPDLLRENGRKAEVSFTDTSAELRF